jgi:integrase
VVHQWCTERCQEVPEMAWIEEKKRSDGGMSASVRWRLGGRRSGAMQTETFGAGSDARNRARAEGFLQMVTAAGQDWPDGWVKGEGFVRAGTDVDPMVAPPTVVELGEAYVRQIVDCSPGQRKRYLDQLRILRDVSVARTSGSYRPFSRDVTQVHEGDIKAWLIGWDRSLKTKANYHGLLYGVFNYAIEQGYLTVNPCHRTAPKRSRIRQSQADLRFLTEPEFAIAARTAGGDGDMLAVTVGTGMRFGEVTALWVGDVDLRRRTIRINKAWKRDGEDSEQDTPSWLKKSLRAKHQMRGHHLGNPKTPKSRRTIEISDHLVAVLRPHVEGRPADDLVFVTPTGLPLHNSDYYERVWTPLMGELRKNGIAPFRFHDLRHTHVAWLVAGGVPLPHIQARLGHESITTTIDTYGHLLPVGDELISDVIDTALRGGEIRPVPMMRLVEGGGDRTSRSRATQSQA